VKVAVNGQARPDILLGRAQLAEGMAVTNGQVRDDVVELALERGKVGEGREDALGQGAERAGITRGAVRRG
jgi:hypothetical protein